MSEPKTPNVEDTPRSQKLRRTPLHSIHRRLGARMVAFSGWQMPVQYSGIIEEHLAVRSRAGLFDVSHMGQIEVRGARALEFCQEVSCNDIARMKDRQAQYNLLLNQGGGVIDDVVFHRFAADHYMICVNAANADKDFEWLKSRAGGNAEVLNRSADYAQLALQGPWAEKILQGLVSTSLSGIAYYHFSSDSVAGVRCIVARTGYTGEDGFELYCDSDKAEVLWTAVMDAGATLGLLAAGLGARDTLRLERAYPLYGFELSETTTPLEAGLEWVVKLSKGSFLGREVLLKQKEEGVAKKLVGLELIDSGIARTHCSIVKDSRVIGEVTSGTRSPSLKKSIALGYVGTAEARVGNGLHVDIRGRRVAAQVVPLPFYRRPSSQQPGKTEN